MKTKLYYILLFAAVILSSCSHDIYNNNAFLSSHDLNGKKLAILPVEVYYTGIQPSKGDMRSEELTASLETQTELEHAYLMYASRHKASKQQHKVQLLTASQVNQLIGNVIPDVRTAWKTAPDSLGRLAGADVVLKVRLVHTRYMSEGLAKGINTGAAIFDAVVNLNSKGWSSTERLKAYSVDYQVSLIDAKTGAIISSYINKPQEDHNGDSIPKGNQLMVKQAAVYAAQ